MRNALVLCSTAFSINWRAQKNHISASTVTAKATLWISHLVSCQRCWIIFAKTLPTTARRLIPRQLSHDDKSPFYGTGTKKAFLHSWGALSLSQTLANNSKGYVSNSLEHLWQDTISASSLIPDNTFLISSKEGKSAKWISDEGKELIKSKENTLAVFKTDLKCCCHLCKLSTGVMQSVPSSFLTAYGFVGSSSSSFDISYTLPSITNSTFITLPSISLAFCWNQSFLTFLTVAVTVLLISTYLCCRDCSHCANT